MKSSQARMKSSAFASDEIKSASPNPTKSDFIAKRFHPTQVGFLPPSADLVEKSTHCLGRQMCAFFLVAEMGFEPHDLRVMSPASYQTAPLRDILVPEAGVEPVREKISRDFKSRASANSAIPANMLPLLSELPYYYSTEFLKCQD